MSKDDAGRRGDDATEEPFAGLREDTSDDGSGWGAALLRLLLAVVVLGAAYLGAAWWLHDRPAAGLSVAGTDIGTLSEADARAKVLAEVDELRARPIRVQVLPEGQPTDEAQELLVVPEKAGLDVDIDKTLEGVGGFTLDPRELWARLAGQERELPLVTTVDDAKLRAELGRLAKDYDREPVEGDVRLGDTGVEVTAARPGRELDIDATAEAVREAWPTSREADGTVASVAPLLTEAEIERFTQDELEPALDKPVVVVARAGSGDASRAVTSTLARRDLAAVVEVRRTKDHTLRLAVDDKALLRRLRADLGTLESGARDATVRLLGNDVQVVPARGGARLPDKKLVAGVKKALGGRGTADRRVTVDLQKVAPAISTATARGWNFSTMGEFSSPFPTGPGLEDRVQNLDVGIRKLNGVVVMPGQQFSLGASLSPITKEGGYAEASVIVNGRLEKGVGGGLSQISTTVFNTSWLAGVQLDAHTPHSFYISRYPAGREATIAYPGLDNLWTNDTSTPVVIRSWIEGSTIHMQFLGHKQYTVRTIDGPRTNVTQPQKIVDDSEKCVSQTPAEGFDITVRRELLSGGQVAHVDEFTTHYIPEDEVECTHPGAG